MELNTDLPEEIMNLGDHMSPRYRPLPLSTTKKGWDMVQHKRGTRACLYAGAQDGSVLRYEVFLIKHHEGREIRGVQLEPAEYFPGDEAFGVWAFCYSGTAAGLAAALRRYDELEAGKRVEEETEDKIQDDNDD